MSVCTPLIEMKEIRKSFSSVEVLKGMNFTLNKGEIVGLIGENGAGKSTLIKILCGIYPMNSGKILYNGKEIDVQNPNEFKELGISTIYQELSLFPTMTVAENIFINRELHSGKKANLVSKLDIRKMEEISREILDKKLKVNIDVKSRISDLPLAKRQMVEIARALSTESKIIIMDEPTTALEDKEKQQLFEIMKSLKAAGCSIVFISHHLDELFATCDRINVLRDGSKVLDEPSDNLSMDELISAMIGKTLDEQYPKQDLEIGETYFKVENLCLKDVFKNISLDVHKKEIIGIVGLAGCGKNEFIRSLFGVCPYTSGKVTLNNKELAIKNVKNAKASKIAFLPAERKVDGIFPLKSVMWNTSIADLDYFIDRTKINKKRERETCLDYVSSLRVKLDNIDQTISSLSGGNQQKIMLARWLLTEPEVLLLEEPTRGIDVNAKTEVYNLIAEYVKKDKAVIMVSSEEEEVYGICDRIVIMHDGEISTILNAKDTSLEQIKYHSKVKESK